MTEVAGSHGRAVERGLSPSAAANVASRLIDGHGRGISASPPPPPAQQSSWSAALVPAIRDVDSPPPQDRGLDASFPPVTHALSAPPAMTSLRSPESFQVVFHPGDSGHPEFHFRPPSSPFCT